MTAYIFFKYLHLLAIITMLATLAIEITLVKTSMIRNELRRVSRVDAVYGVSAIIAVIAGLTLWFGVGKGSEFYVNPVLHVKVGIVILVGLISIVPTVFFIRHSKGDQTEWVPVPRKIRILVLLQILMLAIVPLLATMMANGLRF
jgi:putative membrane protein